MLKSMTGFGIGDYDTEEYKIHIEMKSVNQRYCDIEFHIPNGLNSIEDEARKIINKQVLRGKVDVYVNFSADKSSKKQIKVDKGLAIAYHKALNEMSDLLHLARPDDIGEIAQYPGVLTMEEGFCLEGYHEPFLQALSAALSELMKMRRAEGEYIYGDLQMRVDKLVNYVEKIDKFAPQIVDNYRQRLQKTIDDVLDKKNIDELRIIQETAIYADKVNFTEELVRLQSHFKQFEKMIEIDEPAVGRKLDFLVQEMNRETNTIAAKANCAEVAQLVVDVKGEIEKIREQLQNIE